MAVHCDRDALLPHPATELESAAGGHRRPIHRNTQSMGDPQQIAFCRGEQAKPRRSEVTETCCQHRVGLVLGSGPDHLGAGQTCGLNQNRAAYIIQSSIMADHHALQAVVAKQVGLGGEVGRISIPIQQIDTCARQ